MRAMIITFAGSSLLSISSSLALALLPYKHHIRDFRSLRALWSTYKVQTSNLDVCLLSIVFSLIIALQLGVSLCLNRRSRSWLFVQFLQSIGPPIFQASPLIQCASTTA